MSPGEAVAAVAFFGLVGAVVVPLARAFAKRIGGGAADNELLQEVHSLRDEVDQLRGEIRSAHGELDDVQGRLNFAERMLAQNKDRALPGA